MNTIAVDLEAFGEALRAARSKRDFTAQNLADLMTEAGIPVTYQAVGGWERGESEPSRDKVFLMERILQRPLSHHLGYRNADEDAETTDYNTRLAKLSPEVQAYIESIIEREEGRL